MLRGEREAFIQPYTILEDRGVQNVQGLLLAILT